MKKKIVAGLLVAAMTMSLMGCAAEEKITEVTGGSEAMSDAAADTIVTVVTHSIESKKDDKVLATGSYPEIILSEDYAASHSFLADRINDLNGTWEENVKTNTAENAGWAAVEEPVEEGEYYMDYSVDLPRIDDKIFTIMVYESDYTGGAHPNRFSESYNYNVDTGDEIGISEIVTDTDAVTALIKNKLEEEHPGILEEVESFYYDEDGTGDAFKSKFAHDAYTWNLTSEGLHIYFSPYEIASYAAGDMEVLLSYDDLGDLIKEEYKITEEQDMSKLVETKEGETSEVEPEDKSDVYNDAYVASVDNPSWNYYCSDEAKPAAAKHISLTETSKEKTDWLKTEDWANENGFTLADPNYDDGTYTYVPYNGGDYGYEYTSLTIYDTQTYSSQYDLDLFYLCMGADDETNDFSAATQYIRWAKLVDGVLYVSVGHNGYATEEPNSCYMVAINPDTAKVIWRSNPLVSNASNFQIVDDTIICSYGFTSEPDYIYLLDKNTGETVESIPVESMVEQMEIKDDTLYVATYDTAYTYKINR
ncbi:MAG: DUF3298 and DUF4163 domain-containing protein [Pseudobutyrivibrio sp.]|nr:DUF3298 and DUF4163 domain-containing protein [Pseudobutyrivibrio sp.]